MSLTDNCVFCKIVRGEIPSIKIYEDDLVLAFLDIAPINKGHILVIPKEHHNSITTVPEKYLSRMMNISPKIAQATVRILDGDGFNLHLANGACAGQIVPHAHMHIIPRFPTDGFSWNWRNIEYSSDDEKQKIADKIIKKMNK
ncbi:MAG: HIT family protein [Verrucomicrobiota bacterium]|nr:HIT family protein [Verrucomicrobiota bacterium]